MIGDKVHNDLTLVMDAELVADDVAAIVVVPTGKKALTLALLNAARVAAAWPVVASPYC